MYVGTCGETKKRWRWFKCLGLVLICYTFKVFSLNFIFYYIRDKNAPSDDFLGGISGDTLEGKKKTQHTVGESQTLTTHSN